MLRFLSIRRLAVIDAVDIEFGPGLNVLTGETGAGKSILVEAVSLLLGARASADLVRTGEETATIEAVFERGDDELIVRREITSQGRSRSFVNGSLVPAGTLKELTAGVVELHGQHEHEVLLDPQSHLGVLDLVGGLAPLAARTSQAFGIFRDASNRLSGARQTASEREARRELAAYQLAELDRAELVSKGEDEELSATRQVLASAERVVQLCTESYAGLYESDGAVLTVLGGIWRKVSDLAALDRRFEPYLQTRATIKSELEDLALFLRRYADSVDVSPERLQAVETRLALLERLKRKYGPSLGEVVDRRDALRQELDEVAHADERMTHLARDREQAWHDYLQKARALSGARRAAASRLAKDLERQLADLAMADARFEVRFVPEAALEETCSASGVDRLEFYLTANQGEELRPLARVASGGELSRLMLALRTLTAASRHQPAWSTAGKHDAALGMIFDEIDAGIGGRVADVVARKLHALGGVFQVLCITHLPQIAAYAGHHFAVAKHVDRGRTRTTVTRLDEEARVDEIGRMLGGGRLTDGIRASARELMARKGESTAKGEGERAKAKPVRHRTGS
jgi:DNA repair protein RecN (Recombination protein N)